ncbi:hypothetical protein HYDPIDRAFT_25650 [Hydnomerulius pinastri MD-312]|nr:hypothetical protein HYDPIDRAFT_25650 [Hydnomerulius pinastri MD-312]
MSHQRSGRPRTKPRSPAPPRTPTTPSHQFLPPSHYAAAAGLSYPFNRTGKAEEDSTSYARTPLTSGPNQVDSCYADSHPFSSNAAHQASELHTSNRGKRKSQAGDLGLLEAHLLPSLKDTIDRMTRPPSQVSPGSPLYARPGRVSSVARTPSCSSQESAYSDRGELRSHRNPDTHTSSLKQSRYYSLSNPQSNFSPSPGPARSSARTKPKSILKSHGSSDKQLQPLYAEEADFYSNHARKADRTPLQMASTSLGSHAEHTYEAPAPQISKSIAEGTLRTGRARSRTDPGTLPRNLSSTRGTSAHQATHQQSHIPRRVEVPRSPAPHRTPSSAHTSDSSSEVGTVNSDQRDKRKLYVTNAEVVSSSSSEGPRSPFTKSGVPSRRDYGSSTESQLRPPRFGLGFGFPGGSSPKSVADSSQPWSWKALSTEPPASRSPSGKKYNPNPDDQPHQIRERVAARHDRPSSRNMRSHLTEDQRRHRELVGLVENTGYSHSDVRQSLASDYSGEDGLAVSSGSEELDGPCSASGSSQSSSGSTFSESGSEYSVEEEYDEEAIRRPPSREDRKLPRTMFGVRQSHTDLARERGG